MSKINKFKYYFNKLLFEIFSMPFYLLSFASIRSNKIWVFGEWHGERYADNSKCLFEYVSKQHADIKVVWITKSKKILNIVHEKKLTAYYAYSFLGIYYCLRAKLVFVTHGASDVAHPFIAGSAMINLTHGVPLKKIGKDAGYRRLGPFTYIFDNYFSKLLPRKKKFDFIFCADERSVARFNSACRPRHMPIATGYPRWDELVKLVGNSKRNKLKLLDADSYAAVVLYAPTLRFNNHMQFNPSKHDGFRKFIQVLAKKNILFVFRPHPSMRYEKKDYLFPNVKVLTSKDVDDVNLLLAEANCLISDYSSIMYDFDILNRSIIHFVPDLDEYINQDVGIYGDYHQDSLGPVCESWSEVEEKFTQTDFSSKTDTLPQVAYSASICDILFKKIINK